MTPRTLRAFGVSVLVASAIFGAGCSSTPATSVSKPAEQVAVVTSSTPASALRSQMNRLLEEHVYIAMNATDAALGGRTDQYNAAVAALDTNSVQLGGVITSAYGDAAGKAFLDGWRRHIGFFVDYTNGVAKKDATAKSAAVANLNQYAKDLADLLNAANGLPKDAVTSLVQAHAVGLCAIIDTQGAGDHATQFVKTRASAEQISQIADPLTEATVLKFPDKFAPTPAKVSTKP